MQPGPPKKEQAAVDSFILGLTIRPFLTLFSLVGDLLGVVFSVPFCFLHPVSYLILDEPTITINRRMGISRRVNDGKIQT